MGEQELSADNCASSSPESGRGNPTLANKSAEAFEAWRATGAYLPPILRDFHDQKELFKALDEVLERYNARGESYQRITLSWIDAHKYTVDVFLWVMAGHGYTLQRSRQRFPFADYSEFVGAAMRRWRGQAASVLMSAFKRPDGAERVHTPSDQQQRSEHNLPSNTRPSTRPDAGDA